MKFDFSNKNERIRFYKQAAWKGVNGVRNKVLERDNFECQWCKEKGLVTTTKLEVDHITELEYCTYQEGLDMDNLRTLCQACHNKRHNRFDGRKVKYNKYIQDERW